MSGGPAERVRMARRLLSVVVSSFDDDESDEPGLGGWPDLPFGRPLQQDLMQALDEFEYRCERGWQLLDRPAHEIASTVLNRLQTADGTSVLIVHVLGHGKLGDRDQRLRVVGSDSNGAYIGTEVEQWLSAVEERPDDAKRPYTLFLLDLCYSGQAARLDWQASMHDEDRRAWVIAGSSPDAPAFDGRFSRATVSVLRAAAKGGLDTAPGVPYIPLQRIAQEIRHHTDQLGKGHYPQRVTGIGLDIASSVDLPFFPNPKYDDEAARRLARRTRLPTELRPFLDDLDGLLDWQHFMTRAAAMAPGTLVRPSLFRGRTAELARLAPWLDGEGSGAVAIVTGSPGAGKSALLGVLVCAAHPVVAAVAGMSMSAVRGELPGRNRDLLAVHARQCSVPDVLESLARQLGLPDGSDTVCTTPRLVEAVTARSAPPVFIVDAFDEALHPTRWVDELLRPLAEAHRPDGSPACRLLIGGRPHRELQPLLALARADGLVVDLDCVSRDVLRQDLKGYVADMLWLGAYGEAKLRQSREAIATKVADVLTAPSDAVGDERWGEFLVAQLFALHLSALPPVCEPARAAALAATVPRSLPEVFELDLSTRERDVAWLRPVLTAAAHGFGAGTPRQILQTVAVAFAAVGNPEPTQAQVDKALDAGRFYLRQDVDVDGTTLYRLFHQGLSDYLHREDDQVVVFERLLAHVGHDVDGVRRWVSTVPYVLRHAADHAAAGGRVDEVITDPEFLVYADPDSLARVLHEATTPDARRCADLVRISIDVFDRVDAEERRQILAVDATRLGLTEIAERLTAPLADSAGLSALGPDWVTSAQTAASLRHVLIHHGSRAVTAVDCGRIGDRPIACTGGFDGVVRLWDLRTGQQFRVLDPLDQDGGRTRIDSLAFGTFDGFPVLLTGGGFSATLWNLSTGEQIYTLKFRNLVEAVACDTCEGIPVIVVADSHGIVWITTPGGQNPMPIEAHQGRVHGLAIGVWDRDLPVVASCGEGGTVRVSAVVNGAKMATVPKGDGYAQDIAFAELGDDTVVVTADLGGTCRVWDPTADRMLGTYRGHRTFVEAVATGQTATATFAVSGGYENVVHVWDVGTAQPLAMLAGHTDAIMSLAVGDVDGTPVAVSGSNDGTARVWDIDDAIRRGAGHSAHRDTVKALTCITLAGRAVAISGSEDGTARVWDVATGELLRTMSGHRNVYAVAAGRLGDDDVLVTGGSNGLAGLWHIGSGEPLVGYPGPDDGPRSLADIGSGVQVRGVAWAELEGRPVVVTASIDDHARVWDAVTGREVRKYAPHGRRSLCALAVANLDGEPCAITAAFDRTALVWSLRTGDTLGVLDHGDASDPNLGVTSVTIGDIDGRPIVITGAGDGTRLWNPADGTLIGQLEGTERVDAVAYGAVDGTPVVVLGDCRGRVQVWDLATQPVARYRMPARVRAVSVAPGGQIVVAFGFEVAVLKWRQR